MPSESDHPPEGPPHPSLAATASYHPASAAPSGMAPPSPTGPFIPAEDAAPARVPGYEILRELGRGGMGVVYKARQLGFNRLVALKMILSGSYAGDDEPEPLPHRRRRPSPGCSTPTSSRSTRSASTRASRSSRWSSAPAAGWTRNSTARRCRRPRRRLLVETLARAVQAAHDKGVIHRDLKPANVLLAADGTPKVTDFGLAKRTGREAGQTATGAVMGTPSYMAPEQAGGKSKDIRAGDATCMRWGRSCTSA